MKFLRPTHPYIAMRQGFPYLVVILDWSTRRVVAWRLSNTLTVGFCIEALREALARFGTPEIFNSDQGSQFTSEEFTGVLREHGVQISMDGRGRCHDKYLRRAPLVDREARMGLPAPGRDRHRTKAQPDRILRLV